MSKASHGLQFESIPLSSDVLWDAVMSSGSVFSAFWRSSELGNLKSSVITQERSRSTKTNLLRVGVFRAKGCESTSSFAPPQNPGKMKLFWPGHPGKLVGTSSRTTGAVPNSKHLCTKISRTHPSGDALFYFGHSPRKTPLVTNMMSWRLETRTFGKT